jgi:hypothetical protein
LGFQRTQQRFLNFTQINEGKRLMTHEEAEQALDAFAAERARLISIKPKGKATDNPALYEWQGQWWDLCDAHSKRCRDDEVYSAADNARSEKERHEAKARIEAQRVRDVEFVIKYGKEEQAIEKHAIEAVDLAKRIPRWGKKRLIRMINDFWRNAGDEDDE